MIVVSLGLYTLLCILVGFFFGALFSAIIYLTRPKEEISSDIPPGNYLFDNGKMAKIVHHKEAK